MKYKYLIIGDGYLGRRFKNYLEDSATILKEKINNIDQITKAIELYEPEILINCAGKTGKPNVDACEKEPEETFFGNVSVPWLIAEACKKKNKRMVHLGTGCIYEGDKFFTEEDTPNFEDSLYSRTKLTAEKLLKNYDNVLQIRLRIPIDDFPSDRNLIDKLLKYARNGGKILIAKNSITPIPFLLEATKKLMDLNKSGIFNVVAKDSMTHDLILDTYQELSGEEFKYEKISAEELDKITTARRSNCTLSVEKLASQGIVVPDVRQAVRECIKNYIINKSKNYPKIKGVILAGGSGSRLDPLTRVTNKHLLPVYDKPMIYYPINTLIKAGIKDILIISGRYFSGHFLELLGRGEDLGVNFSYTIQEKAGGIAEALSLARNFSDNQNIAVILGDNIFEDDFKEEINSFNGGARIFLKEVPDAYRFGVVELDNDGNVINIEEKPKNPKTNYAQTGLYLYDSSVFDIIRTLKPSERGELEITDVNNIYVKKKMIDSKFVKGFWSDAGTFESMNKSSNYIREKIKS